MYVIAVRRRFSAAHRLDGHPGKCSRLHGHTWLVEASFDGDEVKDDGILLDFEELGEALDVIVSEFDHTCLNDLEAFGELQPTAENVARLVYERLETAAGERESWKGARLFSVTVWESPDACATFAKAEHVPLVPRESGHD